MNNEDYLFPHSKIRDIQDQLIDSIDNAIKKKKNLIVHAPTGLGKTAAALGPALKTAIKEKLTVFFLTSRHTQHKIAIETLKQIKEKYDEEFNAVSIIGKKWMCPVPGTNELYTGEFAEYCKKVREDNKCEFYTNTKKSNKFTVKAKKVFEDIKKINPSDSEKIINFCSNEKLCPYELSRELAAESSVIICDYYYVFNSRIKETFFSKTKKELEKSIVIIDEAHNLPFRIKDLASSRLSNQMVRRAINEAKKHKYDDALHYLISIKEILNGLSSNLNNNEEKLVKKDTFIDAISHEIDYEQLVADLEFIGDEVREKQKQSYIGSIASFLNSWLGPDDGFTRIISYEEKKRPLITLSYRCLDPSLVSKDIIDKTYSTILMSGTLTPTKMYKDLLGIENCDESTLKSPFPEKNKLTLIVPKTTTKYAKRSEQQYKEIAEITSDIVNAIPGNSLVFFPSYFFRDNVNKYFSTLCRKTTISEEQNMDKEEKQELLDKFKEYRKTGAVLLAVTSGNFSEGIDLPGDLLKGVVVVGLPLSKPDLETSQLIEYFDKKYAKGWDYGYLLPAFNKSLQSAGRCIRSETDKGIIVFLDERYIWRNYYRFFPLSWSIKVSKDYKDEIERFFHINT
jgi:DNA excision repair protein ERCC-2